MDIVVWQRSYPVLFLSLIGVLEGECDHLTSAALFVRGPKLPPPILLPPHCACAPLTQLPMLPLPLDQTNKRTQQQIQPLWAQKNQDWILWTCELVILIQKDTLSPISFETKLVQCARIKGVWLMPDSNSKIANLVFSFSKTINSDKLCASYHPCLYKMPQQRCCWNLFDNSHLRNTRLEIADLRD